MNTPFIAGQLQIFSTVDWFLQIPEFKPSVYTRHQGCYTPVSHFNLSSHWLRMTYLPRMMKMKADITHQLWFNARKWPRTHKKDIHPVVWFRKPDLISRALFVHGQRLVLTWCQPCLRKNGSEIWGAGAHGTTMLIKILHDYCSHNRVTISDVLYGKHNVVSACVTGNYAQIWNNELYNY